MEGLNFFVLAVFAPVLIIIGVLGFIIPTDKSVTSGASGYNIFHILFGIAGLVIVYLGRESWMRAFNIGFGAIDLYQAAASFAHVFPEKYFRWTRADDVLHIVVGAALIAAGIFG